MDPAPSTRGRRTAGDRGLFGPGSVTWRVHADQIIWIGGLRALYLQALHPEALRGVFTQSGYRDDPWGRLLRTADYVGTITFGSTAEAEAAGARVRGLHERLGLADPGLLRWVHCCEVGSFLEVYARAGGRLDEGDADRYLAEQLAAARLVGLDPGAVPSTSDELADYLDAMRPELSAGREARGVARLLLLPPMPARLRFLTPAQPMWAAVSGLAFASLPGWARRLYGAPPAPGAGLGVSVALRLLRAGADRLPSSLREGPHLRGARARLGPGVPF